MSLDHNAPLVTDEGLLPCPFCGGAASDEGHVKYGRPLDDTWWEDETAITEAFYVNCTACGAVGRSGNVLGFQTKAEAVQRWNTRTSDTPSGGLANRCGGHPEPAVKLYGSPDAFLDRDWTAGEVDDVRAKLAVLDGERARAEAVDDWLWNTLLQDDGHRALALLTEYLDDPATARARAAAELETE